MNPAEELRAQTLARSAAASIERHETEDALLVNVTITILALKTPPIPSSAEIFRAAELAARHACSAEVVKAAIANAPARREWRPVPMPRVRMVPGEVWPWEICNGPEVRNEMFNTEEEAQARCDELNAEEAKP